MGRTQLFDTAEAVRAARAVFWAEGFEQAALPELERVTGLSRSSIYHAFGSKRGLFDAAVESYLDEVIRPRLAPLTASDVAPTALDAYFASLRTALLSAHTLPGSSGCLLVNAATAPIARDESMARIIDDYRAELRAALAFGVAARLPHLDDESGDVFADTITGLVISALVFVRISPLQAVGFLDAASRMLDLASTTRTGAHSPE